MHITSLQNIGIDELYIAFNEAFADYARTWTKPQFEAMLRRRGYNAELSFGAFDDGRLVSFTLNSIDVYNSKPTAYDTGTGTIKEYRGKGLARLIFLETVPVLKQQGVEQYLLEVLQENEKAASLYSSLGFKIQRGLNYYLQDKALLAQNGTAKSLAEFKLIDPPVQEQLMQIWDFYPSWQNSLKSICRVISEFKIVGAFMGKELVGYGIIEPVSGDVPQLAVAIAYRRQGIGTATLNELMKYNDSAIVKVINTEATAVGVERFVEQYGIPKKGAQYEMVLGLTV